MIKKGMKQLKIYINAYKNKKSTIYNDLMKQKKINYGKDSLKTNAISILII